MCSVSGLVAFSKPGNQAKDIEVVFREIFTRAADRGRDSWGVVSIDSGPARDVGGFGSAAVALASESTRPRIVDGATRVVVASNRAEPTTEWVREKTENDIQPFNADGWYVAHNGTIANDKELIRDFELTCRSPIDTEVIVQLLAKNRRELDTAEKVVDFLFTNLVGSYALAITSTYWKPGKVILMSNYKPLYLAYDDAVDVLYFSSQRSYLAAETLEAIVNQEIFPLEVRPYSALIIHVAGHRIQEIDLRPEKQRPQRTLVVCSGGLDSTVAATQLLRAGHDVELLHFTYNAQAQDAERAAVKAVADDLNIDEHYMDLGGLFSRDIGGSVLTQADGEIQTRGAGEAGSELAHEWVPARNLVFISLAVAYAESHGFDNVALGTNNEESSAYPDNEMEFINRLNAVLPYAVAANKRVELLMPVGSLMKHEIVKLGLELNAPLEHTYSCYTAGPEPCNACGPDYMRRVAFEMNGVKDPTLKGVKWPKGIKEYSRGGA